MRKLLATIMVLFVVGGIALAVSPFDVYNYANDRIDSTGTITDTTAWRTGQGYDRIDLSVAASDSAGVHPLYILSVQYRHVYNLAGTALDTVLTTVVLHTVADSLEGRTYTYSIAPGAQAFRLFSAGYRNGCSIRKQIYLHR